MSGAERFRRSEGARLEVDGEPSVIAPGPLPEHRIMRVRLRNAGERPVEVRRPKLRLLDEAGEDLRAAFRPPIVRLEPGGVAALDLVYRLKATEPVRTPAYLEHAGERIALATSARLA